MLKRFIDDHAVERIEAIGKDNDDLVTQLHRDPILREKCDAMGWAARSVEIVTPLLIQDMINAFKRFVVQPK